MGLLTPKPARDMCKSHGHSVGILGGCGMQLGFLFYADSRIR